VFSLGAMRKITEEGVHLQFAYQRRQAVPLAGISMQIQRVLNSDIVMQFDECTPYKIDDRPATLDEAAKSMRMSLRWAKRSHDEFDRGENERAASASSRRHVRNAARRIAGRSGKDRLRRSRHRRPVGGEAEGT
jgi:tRNA-guanine family transglycosylase